MNANTTELERNKAVVIRFNKEVLEKGDLGVFHSIIDENFVNHAALPGTDAGPDSLLDTYNNILRPAIPDLKVEIYDQIAWGDKVSTRKKVRGTHSGELLGIPATGRAVAIDVVDIVRLRDGRYVEHWGINDFTSVLTDLRTKQVRK
ncbi:MAG: ester cyclase [Verrucomicrobiota bacterium]|jgi:predicted ester cyclase